MNINHAQVKLLKEQYPSGTRIELISMSDPYSPVPAGSTGTVRTVDDAGTLHMSWDNGRTLGVIPGEDCFRVLSYPEQEQKSGMTMGGQSQ